MGERVLNELSGANNYPFAFADQVHIHPTGSRFKGSEYLKLGVGISSPRIRSFKHSDPLKLTITLQHRQRHSGGTTHNIWKQAHVFLNLVTNFSIIPLRLMTVVGCACAGSGFALGLYFLLVYVFKGISVVGWTALMLINLFFGGLILISLGVIGEYLGRVLMNLNRIPQFVVSESVNYDESRQGERVLSPSTSD